MSKCKEIDALLIDRLYGELDETAAARFDTHVGDCGGCQSELDALSATREVFRDLPELEPPSSLSAILLHEAAKQAPARAVAAVTPADASPGLIARITSWLTPIMQHPAMAAAAMLVLVVGVAGTMYLRGDSKVAQPEYATGTSSSSVEDTERLDEEPARAAAPTAPAGSLAPNKAAAAQGDIGVATAPSEDDGDDFGGAARDNTGYGRKTNALKAKTKADKIGTAYAADVVNKDQEQKLGRAQAQAQTARGGENEWDMKSRDTAKKMQARKPRREVSSRQGRKHATRSSRYRQSKRPAVANAVTGADPLVDTSSAADLRLPTGKRTIRVGKLKGKRRAPRKPSLVADGTVGLVGGVAASGGGTASRNASPPPPPATKAPSSAPAPAPAPALSASQRLRKQKRAKAELAWARSQQRDLARAAKRHQCRTVAHIANDIRARNVAYWNANIRYAKSVKPCAKLISSDWRRRRRVRGKRRYAAPAPKRAKTKSSASKPADAKAAPRKQDEANSAVE